MTEDFFFFELLSSFFTLLSLEEFVRAVDGREPSCREEAGRCRELGSLARPPFSELMICLTEIPIESWSKSCTASSTDSWSEDIFNPKEETSEEAASGREPPSVMRFLYVSFGMRPKPGLAVVAILDFLNGTSQSMQCFGGQIVEKSMLARQ